MTVTSGDSEVHAGENARILQGNDSIMMMSF